MCVWNCPIKEMWKPVRNSARKKIFGRMRPKQKKNKHNPSINQWEESNRLYKSIQKEKHERMSLLLPPTRTIPPRPMPPLRTVPPLGRCRYSDVPGWVDAASDDGASSGQYRLSDDAGWDDAASDDGASGAVTSGRCPGAGVAIGVAYPTTCRHNL